MWCSDVWFIEWLAKSLQERAFKWLICIRESIASVFLDL